ncbi:MAG TPA: diaminopimelate epimerase [Plasticicumulans sp.]|nr:diaminopimelate epimerase [Plasticicumulans sp.]HNF66640.1 diaminopimelate epimerase [Plasticicumulans sp.]HNI22429.1 diaminopimelate epimerase [Plasticicumulans sp.]HNJ08216.1 diaminopimelate epimerase [Plasticicumulans sp.]
MNTRSLRFSKMHGLGNDFVVIDGVRQPVTLDADLVRRLGDRHFGVGFDQLLLVEPPTRPGMDFRYRIWNADGGEVEQCGNGARCFARFVRDHGLSDKDAIAVETAGGDLVLHVEADGRVTVNMGAPRFEPADIPFEAPARALHYAVEQDEIPYFLSVLSMGNPHAVLTVDSVAHAPVTTLGPKLEHHPRFPKRVNVGFIEGIDRSHVRVRVWERGAGETLACGTGACAAVVAGRLQGWLDERVEVELRGGRLTICWAGEGEPVYMTGPAVRVFDGTLNF